MDGPGDTGALGRRVHGQRTASLSIASVGCHPVHGYRCRVRTLFARLCSPLEHAVQDRTGARM